MRLTELSTVAFLQVFPYFRIIISRAAAVDADQEDDHYENIIANVIERRSRHQMNSY